MKESQLNEPFMLALEAAFDQQNIPQISRSIRRGVSNTPHHHPPPTPIPLSVNNSKVHFIKSVSTTQETIGYPWTAFGAVEVETEGELMLVGTGAIIGSNIVLAARPIHHNMKSQKIWFVPFGQQGKEKYQVQRVYPSSNVRQNDDSSDAVILEVNKKNQLEKRFGSLGYLFGLELAQNKHSFIISGIQRGQPDRRELVLASGSIKLVGKNFRYNLEVGTNPPLGSLILYEEYGELFVCGLHLAQKQKDKRGAVLTKDLMDRLRKCTFQGYVVDLDHHPLREKEIDLLEKVSMKKITSLNLQATILPHSGVKAISSRHSSKLSQLNISSNRLTDDDLRCLVNSPWKDLNYLYACIITASNRLQSQAMKYLHGAAWKNLIHLELNHNHLGTKGIDYLIKSNWTLLEHLFLQNTDIDNQGCSKLSRGRFRGLKELSLKQNRIKRDGVMWLVKGDWQALKYLNLNRNQLREDGVKALLEGQWPKLHILNCSLSNLKCKGVGLRWRLKAKFKDLVM